MVIFPKLSINNHRLVQAWEGLMRRIQTTVEHMRVTNTEVAAMVRGQVVGLVAGQRRAELAAAGAAGNKEWVGIVSEPIAAGETGIVRTDGYAYVLFDTGLIPAPVAGEEVFLSETSGLATNVEPVTVGAFVVKIGTIGDASFYTGEEACGVYLQHCCLMDRGQ